MVDLTNGYSFRIQTNTPEARKQKDVIWNQVYGFYQSGYLMGAGSNPGSDTNAEKGIAFGHAYGIRKLYMDSKYKLIQLQNPWGRGEWEGDWSDDSPLWTKYYKNKLGYSEKDEGTFWMNFDDFCNFYSNIYICRLLKPITTFESEWNEFTSTGPRDPTNAPHFIISVRFFFSVFKTIFRVF